MLIILLVLVLILSVPTYYTVDGDAQLMMLGTDVLAILEIIFVWAIIRKL